MQTKVKLGKPYKLKGYTISTRLTWRVDES